MTSDERSREEQMGWAQPGWTAVPAAVMTTPEPLEPPRISLPQAVQRVVLGLLAGGVVVGVAWALLAPPIRSVIALTRAGERVQGYVGEEADHIFLGAFLMVGLLAVLAVIAAVAAWRIRAHRGPELVGALTLGAMLAAGVATGVGVGLARLRHGVVDLASAPVTPEHRLYYYAEAPAAFFGHSPWQLALTVVFPAGIAALVYAIAALSAARDDLGAWTAATAMAPAPPIGPAPTGGAVPPGDPSAPWH